MTAPRFHFLGGIEKRGGVHFSHERIIHFALRERDGFEAKRGNLPRGWRRESGDVAEIYQGEGDFTLGINIQKAIDASIDEAANHPGWQTQGGGDGQLVREESAVVPAEMAIAAGLILPGVAPVDAGANDGEWRVGDGGFAGGGFDEDATIVSGAQSAQAELGGGEVIDAGIEVSEGTANEIELDLVERAGAGGGAKVEFTARIFSLAGDAGGEVEELGHRLQIRRGIGVGRDASRHGREGGDAGLAQFGGQAQEFERGINLERQRLVGPVHEMEVAADTSARMFGGFVIGPSGFGIAAVRHGNDKSSAPSKGSIAVCATPTLERGSYVGTI